MLNKNLPQVRLLLEQVQLLRVVLIKAVNIIRHERVLAQQTKKIKLLSQFRCQGVVNLSIAS